MSAPPKAKRPAEKLARDGPKLTGAKLEATDTGEIYDLVVAGGGFAGLGAAHFYRKAAGPDRTVLVIDNHPIWGGEAKRNEVVGDRSGRKMQAGRPVQARSS